jgi:hypothetical protein
MNAYHYLRAVLFAIAMFALGALILTANFAQAQEQPKPAEQAKGNIDTIIAVLTHNRDAGAKDVVVMITEEHDGPPTRRLRAISAVSVPPEAPDLSVILVIDGKDI